jgi:hypothetical protein
VKGQFSYHPKKTNLTMAYTPDSGWTLTNSAGNKTYCTFNQENVYIQIVQNELRVYHMSQGLWNSHPDSRFMDIIHVPYESYRIDTNKARFDPFSSFWVSASGGHIRIFKYYEKMQYPRKGTSQKTYYNQYVANHIYLNQNKKSKMTSKNTIFMITPQGNIFEIDHQRKIWRFILKNRTLTAWSSDPPKENMMFHIFNKEDFKAIIPIGIKDGMYQFQVINHQNKMGLAALTKDYFQVIITVPPLFDFISPALNNDFHYIYNENRLGVLFFLPTEKENEIPEFRSFYTSAQKQIGTTDIQTRTSQILSDDKSFKIAKNNHQYKSTDFKSDINYRLEIVHSDLLLYNEYSEEQNVFHSGLYRISQNRWYLKPDNHLLTQYPTAILQTQNIGTQKPLSYSVYTLNGDPRAKDQSELTSPNFFYLASLVTDTPMDSIEHIKEYDNYTYKFKNSDQWGLMRIYQQDFSILVPSKHDKIIPFGDQKSLLLFKEQQLGWYGMNYRYSSTEAQWIPANSSSIHLYSGNSTEEHSCNGFPDTEYSAEYINKHYVFNTHTSELDKAWIQKVINSDPLLPSQDIETYLGYFNVTSDSKMVLYNHKLKSIELPSYDSTVAISDVLLLYNTQNQKTISEFEFDVESSELVASYYKTKPISFKKFDSVYYYNNYFVVHENNEWNILSLEGKSLLKSLFKSADEAFKQVNSWSK